MKYPKFIGIIAVFIFVGMNAVGICSKSVVAEEWSGGFEAFKPADDTKYHMRNTGSINWGLYQEQSSEKSEPLITELYWVEHGGKGWLNRLKEAEGQSRVKYLTPANLDEGKYQSPCPLCGKPTYFWLDSGHIDSDTVKHINADYPDWEKADGVCRNCFECYAVRSGKWYDGNLASTTDQYVFGYKKSRQALDYFSNVK
ncbi:MAG: hypothetical protein SCARUB_00179 [Candidatus Scalindua rubra]|uniref:Uncharacterized protein n=1 Tax=Candidatus Scalindua rubra TaxID=1872076 RepID=A0A1E3XG66_9BACT|nr:MAG: hypothetical protein SCARUB_00179 [Candidatus Scalindua rubra]